MSHKPIVFIKEIELDPPASEDKTADADRLKNRLEEQGIYNLTIPLHILKRLPEELRKNDFRLRLHIGVQENGFRVIDIGEEKIFGIALDIGSSNMECSLVDLHLGVRLGTASAVNPQVKFGSDVLSRVQHVMAGIPGDLTAALLEGINELIGDICRKNGVSPEAVYATTIAGNTIMTHFFLGLDVRNIPVSPYIPAINSSIFLSAGETGLRINEHAVVYAFPNAGSYVGGDIVSGIIYSKIYEENEPVLFIDVGTNVEVTIGCSDWIMTGAGAAGPALEEGVARIGTKAKPGTIRGVRIDPLDKTLQIDVMGGDEPSGICGSAMIELIAEMYSSGLIDQSGTLVGDTKGVTDRNGEKAYLLFQAGEKELFLAQHEIRNFLLSKAAMFSFLYVFVKSLGLTFRDIGKVYVAGSLGCGINLEKAIAIGLLPDMPREKFIPLGNSSLGGAEMALLNRDLIETIKKVSRMITYNEMNENNDLMNVLQGAMFIPHTEPELLKG